MRRLIVAAILSLAMMGQAGADGEKIRVSKEVWAAYQAYVDLIGSMKHGVFAITPDGGGAGSWICPENRCSDFGQYKSKARSECEKLNPGADCIIFAVDDDIKVEYEVAQ